MDGQRLVGVWYAVLQPVPLAVVAVAAALATNAARFADARRELAVGLAISAILTIVFFGGWSSPVGGLSGPFDAALGVVAFAAKTAAVAWAFERLRRRVGDRDPYVACAWSLGPAAFVSTTLTAVALSGALAVRTPMGQGLLAEAAGPRLWIGRLGLAYFFAVAAVTALAALGVARALRARVAEAG